MNARPPPPPAVAFDLGDTLVEYEGLPLSWEAHYAEALRALARELGAPDDEGRRAAAAEVLRTFNTRLHPRTAEVPFAAILARLAPVLGGRAAADPDRAARAFFAVFRQRLRGFPEAAGVLRRLRAQGRRLGIFTDVPYGMPRTLVLEDLAATGLADAVDVLLTSVDVGHRKPAPAALHALAATLGCPPPALVYVGNERKDVEAALAVGAEAVLLVRCGAVPAWGQHRTLRTLAGL